MPVLKELKLRQDIWDAIDQDKEISYEDLIERFYHRAPSGASEGQFRDCVRSIRGKVTLRRRPRR